MEIKKIVRLGHSSSLTKDELWDIYKSMKTQRILEDRLLKMYKGGQLSGAVYPGIGQEASMAGIGSSMEIQDVFGGTHRDLGVQINRGVTLKEIALNFYGKKDGPSKGRDGNSHFGVIDKGTLMVVSPLPDSAPVALGVALIAQFEENNVVAVANCGEGATATGTWHETINMAGVHNLPIIFTVQNNQFAYSSPNETEFGTPNVADRGLGYGIESVIIDGNNIYEVINTMHKARKKASSGKGPTLIELVTFRHYGHAGHDPAEYVGDEVREFWMDRDPIARFEDSLSTEGLFTEGDFTTLTEKIDAEVRETLEWAKNQDDPNPEEEIQDIFQTRSTPVATNDGSNTKTMNFIEAITNGLDEAMENNKDVFMMGEDIGAFEGAFKATKGLHEKYGSTRVLDTPISEAAFMGAAVGAALYGKIPIVELQFFDFIYPALDQITTEAAKYFWKAGKPVPMVVRGPTGAGTRSGPFHSISPESLLAHHPGIKVVAPANPYDAKGLLIASINDPNPVMFLEHKKLYRKPDLKMEVPLGLYEVEIGKANIVKEGFDVTLVAWSGMVPTALEAAATLNDEGISVEVIDLRSIFPIDEETILKSVEKTSNLVILQEDVPFSSIASEISSFVADKGFWTLDNRIVKVTSPNTHIPFAPVLEDNFIPSTENVIKAIKELQ
jgi:2-oxoisovalerate dehydrogenase E1 component|tara:strand:- start:2004 stop:4010 length:2007 start_codon:yes stop_codon:yes gene_type:complete